MCARFLAAVFFSFPLFAQALPKTITLHYRYTGLIYVHNEHEHCPPGARRTGTIDVAGVATLGADQRYRGVGRQQIDIDACGVTEETRRDEGDDCLATVTADVPAHITVEFGGLRDDPTIEVELTPQGGAPVAVKSRCDAEFTPYLTELVREGTVLRFSLENTPDLAVKWLPEGGLRPGVHEFREDADWAEPSEAGGWVLTITAGRVEPLKAVIDGPHRTERAAHITLNSSRSRGFITSRRWTLAPLCPESGAKSVTAEGEQVETKLLCRTRATLTVSDGTKANTATTVIEVDARAWETPFEHVDEEGHLSADEIPLAHYNSSTNTFEARYVAGENVPLQATLKPQEYLFPNDRGAGWDANGFVLEQIKEGPFAGVWYVARYDIGVQRKTMLNRYLLPGVEMRRFGSFYEENRKQGLDVDGYLAAIRAHEGLRHSSGTLGHSGLIEKSLRTDDPARKLEAMFAADRDTLVKRADDELRATNRRLCEATKDPLPEIWRGELIFPYDDASGWTPPTTATVGGSNYAYQQMGPCP